MVMAPVLECPTFHPTLEDVTSRYSFEEYVEKLERSKKFASAGIAKIVMPAGWQPRRGGYEGVELELPRPIRQHATGRQGLYRLLLVAQRKQPLSEFKHMSADPLNAPPPGADVETLERKFWKNVTLNPPLYGADVPGSLFDERAKGWNLRHLSSLLSRTLSHHGVNMPGVLTPYLYVGSWRSTFAWHTEDMDLHSVNYLHCGAPKSWYVVPPAHRERFERLMRTLVGDLFRECPEFLRHKELLVSPHLLATHGIPLVRALHCPREFVVVYPGAYHSGFNHGFNLAESVNFATRAWLPVGARAGYCECREDTAKIDMRLFADHMNRDLREEVFDMYTSSEDGSGGEDGESGDSSSAEASSSAASGSSSEEEEGEGEEEEEDLGVVAEALDSDDADYSAEEERRAAKRRRASGSGGGRAMAAAQQRRRPAAQDAAPPQRRRPPKPPAAAAAAKPQQAQQQQHQQHIGRKAASQSPPTPSLGGSVVRVHVGTSRRGRQIMRVVRDLPMELTARG